MVDNEKQAIPADSTEKKQLNPTEPESKQELSDTKSDDKLPEKSDDKLPEKSDEAEVGEDALKEEIRKRLANDIAARHGQEVASAALTGSHASIPKTDTEPSTPKANQSPKGSQSPKPKKSPGAAKKKRTGIVTTSTKVKPRKKTEEDIKREAIQRAKSEIDGKAKNLQKVAHILVPIICLLAFGLYFGIRHLMKKPENSSAVQPPASQQPAPSRNLTPRQTPANPKHLQIPPDAGRSLRRTLIQANQAIDADNPTRALTLLDSYLESNPLERSIVASLKRELQQHFPNETGKGPQWIFVGPDVEAALTSDDATHIQQTIDTLLTFKAEAPDEAAYADYMIDRLSKQYMMQTGDFPRTTPE